MDVVASKTDINYIRLEREVGEIIRRVAIHDAHCKLFEIIMMMTSH